jgi:hypothetical protein
MAWTFNPFSGTIDQKGSGGGGASYIDGEVATYADLPLDVSAALNSAWLVRTASGVWPVSRKQAGIYIRTATGGSNRDSDYTYAGTLPDVFSDSQFLLYDNSDSSRNLAFDLGNITTGTTRTLTAPNASGRIQIEGQAIGNTTPAAGTFTTLALPTGSAVGSASAPALSIGAANTGIYISGNQLIFTQAGADRAYFDNSGRFFVTGAGGISIGATGSPLNFTRAISLNPDANGELHQRSTTQSQSYFLYNTFTSATNHERGFLKWSSNVFQIGTEKGSGGGTARNLEIQTDGITRISWSGAVGNTAIGVGLALIFNERVRLIPSGGDGILRLTNIGDSGFDRLQFGGTTTSFPALKRSSAILQARLADDSGYTTMDALHRLQGAAPATTGATGTAGDIRYDADYIYVCTATNTWKRVAIATW